MNLLRNTIFIAIYASLLISYIIDVAKQMHQETYQNMRKMHAQQEERLIVLKDKEYIAQMDKKPSSWGSTISDLFICIPMP